MKSIKKNLKLIPINPIKNKILSYSIRMDLTSKHLKMQMYNKLVSRSRLLDVVPLQTSQMPQLEAHHELLILEVVNQLKSLSQILDVVLQQTDQDHLLVAVQHQMFQDLHQVVVDKLEYIRFKTRKLKCLLKNSL
jgi:hypothetical protein